MTDGCLDVKGAASDASPSFTHTSSPSPSPAAHIQTKREDQGSWRDPYSESFLLSPYRLACWSLSILWPACFSWA